MPVKWIVFDLSGIILTDGLATASKIIEEKYSINSEELKRYLVGDPARAYRTGEESAEVFWSKFQAAYPGADAENIRRIFFESYELVPEAFEFIKRIPKQYRLASFSYNPPDRAKYLTEKFQFEQLFEQSIYGTDVNASKFEAEAYVKLAEKLGVECSEVMMIDDRQEFVDASLTAGLPTIFFRNFVQLQEDLSLFGIELV